MNKKYEKNDTKKNNKKNTPSKNQTNSRPINEIGLISIMCSVYHGRFLVHNKAEQKVSVGPDTTDPKNRKSSYTFLFFIFTMI